MAQLQYDSIVLERIMRLCAFRAVTFFSCRGSSKMDAHGTRHKNLFFHICSTGGEERAHGCAELRVANAWCKVSVVGPF